MLELGISKMALIGAVALVVIGPEKLPGVARTVGALIGKAQKYVADVKAEVNDAMNVNELKKMKETVESAGREVEKGLRATQSDLEKDWKDVESSFDGLTSTADSASDGSNSISGPPAPEYQPPRKHWRVRRGSTPRWYKARGGVRQHVQSGAARMKRYRPRVGDR